MCVCVLGSDDWPRQGVSGDGPNFAAEPGGGFPGPGFASPPCGTVPANARGPSFQSGPGTPNVDPKSVVPGTSGANSTSRGRSCPMLARFRPISGECGGFARVSPIPARCRETSGEFRLVRLEVEEVVATLIAKFAQSRAKIANSRPMSAAQAACHGHCIGACQRHTSRPCYDEVFPTARGSALGVSEVGSVRAVVA